MWTQRMKKNHEKSFFENSVTVPKMLTFLKKSDIDMLYLVFNK